MNPFFQAIFGNKIRLFIILAVIIGIGFAGFLYYRNSVFSSQILKLEVLGPENVATGDEVEYTIKYRNNSNFTLESPKIDFELPANSLTEDSKTRFTQDLKDINPGVEGFVKFKGRLLGKEGDAKIAKAVLTYTPHNLSVRYDSQSTFITKITSVPITLTYDLPSKVEKGKTFNYSINYFSIIDYPLENLSVKVDPVSGFAIASATPTSLDNAEWKLDTLEKSKGGKISITGAISGETENTATFNVHLGMWQDGVFVVIKDVSQAVEVIQPQLSITQQINGATDYVASAGETLNYALYVRNVGSTPFENVLVVAKLNGAAFDFSTLQSSDGQVRGSDNSIVFDPNKASQLRSIGSQQEAKITFSVKVKSSWSASQGTLTNMVDASGTSQTFTNKVSAKMELSQKAYRSQTGFENSGPIPPKVGQTTTYVVSWQVKNYADAVNNIKVKATLPQGIALGDNIIPEDEANNFSLDNTSRQIFWSVGNLAPGETASISFQVAVTPIAGQQGKFATLVNQATVTGDDQFTNTAVQGSALAVNTSLPDDQSNSGGGIIGQ